MQDEALTHASAAAAAALRGDSTSVEGGYSALQVQLQAIEASVRSLLVQGKDTEALSLAAQVGLLLCLHDTQAVYLHSSSASVPAPSPCSELFQQIFHIAEDFTAVILHHAVASYVGMSATMPQQQADLCHTLLTLIAASAPLLIYRVCKLPRALHPRQPPSLSDGKVSQKRRHGLASRSWRQGTGALRVA